ncbi:MAG: hypothetical protein ACQEQ7_05720 [Thermodesulfobacteriota bacterium]
MTDAWRLLLGYRFMGVEGYELLDLANERGVPALMLTAHALSEENLKKSAEKGAAYYAPKDEMDKITVFVADVLEATEENKNPWGKWFERLAGFYDRKFGGTDWREKEKAFWEEKGRPQTRRYCGEGKRSVEPKQGPQEESGDH